jgi:glycosyltransferase involved in cell wall biosynthesis
MQVVQAVSGVFHHFDLARELESRGYLRRIYSTFPWRRLVREGVPRERVGMFPWLHAPLIAFEQRWRLPRRLSRELHTANLEFFDNWIAARIEPCDVFVTLSGTGLKTGALVQRRGGSFVCDRGSTHIRYQDRILSEEFARWGFDTQICDPRVIRLEEAEYAQADAITVPSSFARRSFLEMGIPGDKVHAIPYGVRLDRFQKTGAPASDSFDVLFAGTVGLRKGVPYLLEAFQQFHHPRKRLRLAGPVDANMKHVFPRFDLTGVEILGRQPQHKLARLMSASHVMVLPSIEEGLALVQGQALACGCPLISSLHTGGEDLFSDGVEGFLVPVRSPQEILSRLIQLAEDPHLRQRMSEAALKRVRTLGGWRDYGDAYSALLQKLTAGRRRAEV